MKAVITAAGLGKRFMTASKAVPKEMLPVIDKPVIQYVVEEARAASVDEVIIVTNDNKPSIKIHFAEDDELISILESKGYDEAAYKVREVVALQPTFVTQEEQIGLGNAVLCAHDLVVNSENELFYLLLGDIVVPEMSILPRLLEVSNAHGGASVIAVLQVPDHEVKRFGVVKGIDLTEHGEAGVWRVTGLEEKPQVIPPPSNMAIFGRYLLTTKLFELLEVTEIGVSKEVQLTDALNLLLEHDELYALIIDPTDGYDVGTVESWLKANIQLALKLPGFSFT